jgi:hypothetical protein
MEYEFVDFGIGILFFGFFFSDFGKGIGIRVSISDPPVLGVEPGWPVYLGFGFFVHRI